MILVKLNFIYISPFIHKIQQKMLYILKQIEAKMYVQTYKHTLT